MDGMRAIKNLVTCSYPIVWLLNRKSIFCNYCK